MFIKFSMPCHVEGQRASHADVSLYVVHAIENNSVVGTSNIKPALCLYSDS